jgi:two-component sensor histidine kinase
MMQKVLFIFLLFFSCSRFVAAQSASGELPQKLRNGIQKSNADTNRIRMLLSLGSLYLSKDGQAKYLPDSALTLYGNAMVLSKALKNIPFQNETLIKLGCYYFEINDLKNGKSNFMKAIESYKKSNDKINEANAWNQFGQCIPDSDLNNIPLKIECFKHAQTIYNSIPKRIEAIGSQQKIAECRIKLGSLAEAEKELQDVISEYKANGFKNLQDTYDLLAQISSSNAHLHKEFFYRMEAVNSMEASADKSRADYFYAKLALTYSDMKMYSESAEWILKAINAIKKNGKYEDLYGDVSLLVFDYITLGKPRVAIDFLNKISLEIPPQNMTQRVDLNEEFAHCYVSMKEYDKAEPYYLEMMRLFNITSFNKAFYTTNAQMVTDFVYYNQTIGNFYVLTKKFKQAGFYYNKILNLPQGIVRPITLAEIHQMQFKVDSASGNFIGAIRHFQVFQNLHDSLFNVTKNKQIEELQIKYETVKKDNDIRTSQQNIQLLTNKSQLQDASLNKAKVIRNIIIISSLVALSFLFVGYRYKQRHNIKLQLQQDEINKQNQELQLSLAQQRKLIAEKEWLVKEIHHRVKNNLQIVISLLNVQSDFLDSPSAISAIQESRERMQAIALIHQKLYQQDYGTLIKMKSYMEELVSYLTSVSDSKRIRFRMDIEDVGMDVSQAVPLGLVLNEAITNALKYAFPAESDGIIEVVLKQNTDGTVMLKISDNGHGFPENFNLAGKKSLGIQLMKLFAEQLEGTLQFKNDHGAQVELVFKKQVPVDHFEIADADNKTSTGT